MKIFLLLILLFPECQRCAARRSRSLVRRVATKRHGELESFTHMCLNELSRIDSLTQEDYAGFLEGYCQRSSIKGPACPSSGEFSFSALPVDLQLLYVDCQSHDLSQQIDCLQFQVDNDQPIAYLGSIDMLCAKSFSAMRSSLFLDPSNDPEIYLIAPVTESNLQSRGVGNTLESNSVKSNKAKKKDNYEGSSTAAAPFPPSDSPVTMLASKDSYSSITANPSLPEPTLAPTISPCDPTVLSSDIAGQEEPHTKFSALRLIGAMSIGILLLSLAAMRMLRSRLRYTTYRNAESKNVVADDASVFSEPSQLFKVRPNADYSQDGSEQHSTEKNWFQRLFRSTPGDFLQKTRRPMLLKWSGFDGLNNACRVNCVSSTSSHDALSKAEDNDHEYPVFNEDPKATMNEEDDTSAAYHFDIYPIADKVSSSLSSASQRDQKRTGTIDMLFKNRGSLFSRRHQYKAPPLSESGKSRIEYDDSAEQGDLVYPSREARHEDDILELEGAADYHNEKPWRKELIQKVDMTCDCDVLENEAPTIDDIEASFLSPDVARQFRDVDQRLSDGLRQVREEDRKLAMGVRKFQASIRKREQHEAARPTMVTNDEEELVIEIKSSPPNENIEESGNRKCIEEPIEASDEADSDTLLHKSETSSVEFEESPTPLAGEQSDTEDQDGLDEDLIHTSIANGGRNPYAPTWIQQEPSDAWKASRSALSLPRHSFDDTEQIHPASLLPPRVDSIDSAGTDGD